jgi:type II secretory pathway pseudopilin PulG
MVFWGSFPIFYLLSTKPVVLVIRSLFGLDWWYSIFLSLLLWAVLILSFIDGVFLIWKRSKLRAVLIAVGVPLMFVGILAAIAIPQIAVYDRAAYNSEMKSTVRVAANAQRSYFAKNNSYKSCVACTSRDLPGFHNSSGVTLKAETGRTWFVLTATHENCGSSVWTYKSTTGETNGPGMKNGCKFRIKNMFSYG